MVLKTNSFEYVSNQYDHFTSQMLLLLCGIVFKSSSWFLVKFGWRTWMREPSSVDDESDPAAVSITKDIPAEIIDNLQVKENLIILSWRKPVAAVLMVKLSPFSSAAIAILSRGRRPLTWSLRLSIKISSVGKSCNVCGKLHRSTPRPDPPYDTPAFST